MIWTTKVKLEKIFDIVTKVRTNTGRGARGKNKHLLRTSAKGRATDKNNSSPNTTSALDTALPDYPVESRCAPSSLKINYFPNINTLPSEVIITRDASRHQQNTPISDLGYCFIHYQASTGDA